MREREVRGSCPQCLGRADASRMWPRTRSLLSRCNIIIPPDFALHSHFRFARHSFFLKVSRYLVQKPSSTLSLLSEERSVFLTFRVHNSNRLLNHLDNISSMSRPAVSRAFNQCIRQSKRPRVPCRSPVLASSSHVQRNASSKHPTDFSPPSNEDLAELRERVRLFTSKFPPPQF